MGITQETLDTVRSQTDAHREPLEEARARLELVRYVVASFPGTTGTYASGSLPQRTFIHPVGDGDGGVKLDRRCYPALGPDGGGETPKRITDDLCALIGPAVREVYPNARCHRSKRGPKILFGQPVDGQDPTVDMVIAMVRRCGNGLWIPNLDTDSWEASDPERHVVLFTSGPPALRQTRRRVIRLLKAWNKQYSEPGFSSHNLSVWAWEFVGPGMGVATALATVLAEAATRVEAGNGTPDPAGVSPDVRLLVAAPVAQRRLRTAADGLAEALDHDDDRNAVLAALSRVYYKYVDDPAPTGLAGKVAALRTGGSVATVSLGISGPSTLIRATRAFGSGSPVE